MKLVRLHIEGFRGFAEKTTVAFDDLTVFVGRTMQENHQSLMR